MLWIGATGVYGRKLSGVDLYTYHIQPVYFDNGTGHHHYSFRAYGRKYKSVGLRNPFKNNILGKIWLFYVLLKTYRKQKIILDFTDFDAWLIRMFCDANTTINVTPYPSITESRIRNIGFFCARGCRLIAHTNIGSRFYNHKNILVDVEASPKLSQSDIIGLDYDLTLDFTLFLCRHVAKKKILGFVDEYQYKGNNIVLGRLLDAESYENTVFFGKINESALNILIIRAKKIVILHEKGFHGESAACQHVEALGRMCEHHLV